MRVRFTVLEANKVLIHQTINSEMKLRLKIARLYHLLPDKEERRL
jgi:hypothetical protein